MALKLERLACVRLVVTRQFWPIHICKISALLPKIALGRQCLFDRSVIGRLSGLGPMAAGNVIIAPMNSQRASDIAGAWMTALWT
jgi:hypothetical protein